MSSPRHGHHLWFTCSARSSTPGKCGAGFDSSAPSPRAGDAGSGLGAQHPSLHVPSVPYHSRLFLPRLRVEADQIWWFLESLSLEGGEAAGWSLCNARHSILPVCGAAVTQIQPGKERNTHRSESFPSCLVGSKYLHGTASASSQGLGKSSQNGSSCVCWSENQPVRSLETRGCPVLGPCSGGCAATASQRPASFIQPQKDNLPSCTSPSALVEFLEENLPLAAWTWAATTPCKAADTRTKTAGVWKLQSKLLQHKRCLAAAFLAPNPFNLKEDHFLLSSKCSD